MTTTKRILGVVTIAFALLLTIVPAADAATKISEPASAPYVVALDAHGKAVPFTIVATGFPPQAPVYVEQCNGRKPSDANWSPTRDCDAGSSPAPAYADKNGVARFDVTDANRALPVFAGLSPQDLFNCLPAGAPKPSNDFPKFETCQIRVASSPTQTTTDQTFLALKFGSAGSSSSSGIPVAALGVVGGIAVIVAIVATVLARRERTPTRT